MKNYQLIFLIAGFLFCTVAAVHAQQTQFQRVYTFFEHGAIATLMTEDSEGYIITGEELNSDNAPDKYFFLQTDLYGKTLWYKNLSRNKDLKNIRSDGRIISPIIRAKDNGFFIVERDSGYTGTMILKLDSTGSMIWEKIIDESYFIGKVQVTESIDGSLYIVKSSGSQANVIKTDNSANVLWNKVYSLSPTSDNGSILKEFSDSSLVIAGANKIIWLDKDGNTAGEQDLSTTFSSMITDNDDNIILGGYLNLEKLDKNGNLIWSVSMGIYTVRYIRLTANGEYAVLETTPSSTYLSKYNKAGSLLWRQPARGYSWNLTQASDGGYLTSDLYASDNTSYNPVITKTTGNGQIQSVSIIFPFKNINAASKKNICWLKNNVDNIDIDFSSDNGITWTEVIHSFPADQLVYEWQVPVAISDQCLLKISDSNNSLIYDQLDSVFSIILPYNAYDYIAANEIKMWIGNNGDGSHNPLTEGQGLFWPGGEEATQGAVFEDGLLFGGKVNGEIRVGGSTYRHGLRPGNVLSDTTAADPDDIRFQVWKIKQDTAMLSETEKSKYEYNYNNWPVDIGAPWVDVDHDGIYTPGVDHPKFYGEETLFNVMNDFDSTTTQRLYGSNPMGLEVQCLTYGMNTRNELMNAVFKQYKLINKSSNEITDMYLSYWADDDMGDANDDYMGVDTTLNLGYSYNGTNNDAVYGTPPPAVGHMIIQGPIVPAADSDNARFDNGWRPGYKNLPATAFVFYLCGSSIYSDPDLGIYDGTLQMYNNMQGLVWNGSSFIDPNTGDTTTLCLSGDPVAGTGWYMGDGWPGGPTPCDVRFVLSSGPFNLAPGDTQEITMALLMALGSDNIQSVAALRNEASYLQEYYNNDLLVGITSDVNPVTHYTLEQNYPNPFNPVTNIEYTIPIKSRVTIKIYDILGREVKVFNQGEQIPMHYRVSFNGIGLASGVYFYRIEAVPADGKSGDFIQTKKMVLLK